MKSFQALIVLLLLTLIILSAQAQEKAASISWMSFEDAIEANAKLKKNKKKIFVDVYTSWCGWCTRMDQTTFKDSAVTAVMNRYFLPVKLNAERRDTVVFKEKTYVNANPGGNRSAHQLAISLLNGRMSYPSFVILNEKEEVIQIIPGYREAAEFTKILRYFGEDAYLSKTWEEFSK